MAQNKIRKQSNCANFITHKINFQSLSKVKIIKESKNLAKEAVFMANYYKVNCSKKLAKKRILSNINCTLKHSCFNQIISSIMLFACTQNG